MIKLATLTALTVLSLGVAAQPRAFVMLGAHHADDVTECAKLQSFTPGAGVAYDVNSDVMVVGGIWRTSQDNWTGFAVADWRPLRIQNVSAGAFVGVSGGYCLYENRYGPIGGLTVRVDVDKLAVHLLYVPSFGSEKNTATAGIGLSHAF